MFNFIKKKKMTTDAKFSIFEEMFLCIIEKPILRWKLKRMIESRDNVDFARLDLDLRKIELEIIERKQGGAE